jgi:hypothetical protein
LRGIVVSGMEDGWFHSPPEAAASHPAQRPTNPSRSPTLNRVKGQANCMTSTRGSSVRAASGPGGNAKGTTDEVCCRNALPQTSRTVLPRTDRSTRASDRAPGSHSGWRSAQVQGGVGDDVEGGVNLPSPGLVGHRRRWGEHPRGRVHGRRVVNRCFAERSCLPRAAEPAPVSVRCDIP